MDRQITHDSSGGCNLGWTNPGEWTDYSISVSAAGNYRASACAANGCTDASITFSVNSQYLG